MEQTGVIITVVVNQHKHFDGTGPRQDGYAHSGSALTINFPAPGLSGRIIVYGGTGGFSKSRLIYII